ncbi:MAG: amidohydrolase family protein [Kiritimatiellaeota bacterium]|nr:amidohydrolase family protein [Kiritimatiellota bacterium]
MVIDFHTHIFPEALAARVLPLLSQSGGGAPYFTDGTARGLRVSMERNGIDKSVFLQIATKASQTPTVNGYAIDQNSADLIAFGSVHPEYPQWREELDRLAAAGVRGIKLHPEYQTFTVDDERMRPIYEYAIAKGLIILFHAGLDIGFPGGENAIPERFLAMRDTLKHGTVILAHGGGWKRWDDVEALLCGTEFYFDTSFCDGFLDAAHARRIIARHGAERILFASDSPWEDQAASLAFIRNLGLSVKDTAAILGENAQRIL